MATESKPIELGTSCPDFKLPATDGKSYALDDFKAARLLLVGFTCNHCPYVQAYESRLIELATAFKSKSVEFICINANDDVAYPDDSFEKMKERAHSQKFNFHYLRDDSQVTAKAFNAECTPEFYLYDEARKLRYHGRIDDNQKEPAAVKHRYLKEAIESLLAGKNPPIAQTSAIGCSIKWK